jgi:hypothetical protein
MRERARVLAASGLAGCSISMSGPRDRRVGRELEHYGLNRLIPIGERHFRRAITEYVARYHYDGITRGSRTN